MRAHILDDSLIINTVLVESLGDDMVDADVVGGGIGDSVIGGQLIPKTPAPGPTYAKQKAEYLDEVRIMREKVLARLNGYGAALYLQDPPALEGQKENCAYLIQGLLDITTITPVVEATSIEGLITAIKVEYARLVGSATADLVKAFRQVDV